MTLNDIKLRVKETYGDIPEGELVLQSITCIKKMFDAGMSRVEILDCLMTGIAVAERLED